MQMEVYAQNVPADELKCDQTTRDDLLRWMNSLLKKKLGSIQDLRSGATYCKLIDRLFPGTVPLERVKSVTHFQRDYLRNYLILKEVFEKLHVDKRLPIAEIIRGSLGHNIQFLRWFRKFYVLNSNETTHAKSSEECLVEKPNRRTQLRRSSTESKCVFGNALCRLTSVQSLPTLANNEKKVHQRDRISKIITGVYNLLNLAQVDQNFYVDKEDVLDLLLKRIPLEELNLCSIAFLQKICIILYKELSSEMALAGNKKQKARTPRANVATVSFV